MIDMHILLPMVSVALLFVLVVTHAWRRSITTAIYIVSVSVAMNCYTMCKPDIAGAVIISGAIVALVRTVINTEDDRFIKRGGGRRCLD